LFLPYHGDSMKGVFRTADFLIIEPCSLISLCNGDVIAFARDRDEGKVNDQVVHRIIRIVTDYLFTKGDNNRTPDLLPVTKSNLIGKVVAFEREGRTHKVRNGSAGLLVARTMYVFRRARYLLINRIRGFLPIRRIGSIVFFLWKPKIQKLKFSTAEGPVIKWVHRNSTIATWLPEKKLLKTSFLYRFLSTQETE